MWSFDSFAQVSARSPSGPVPPRPLHHLGVELPHPEDGRSGAGAQHAPRSTLAVSSRLRNWKGGEGPCPSREARPHPGWLAPSHDRQGQPGSGTAVTGDGP